VRKHRVHPGEAIRLARALQAQFFEHRRGPARRIATALSALAGLAALAVAWLALE
jgi:hypothetical protein